MKETAAPGPVVETCNWTGFYVGAAFGAGWNSYDSSAYDVVVDQPQMIFPPVTFTIPGHNSGDETNFVGGGQLGYNRQFGHFVIGVEGDFQSNDGERSHTFFPPTVSQSQTFGNFTESSTTDLISLRQISTNWLGSIRGRVGFTAGCFLFYATGGAAFTSIEVTARDTATSSLFFNGTFIDSRTDRNKADDTNEIVGWTAGGGVEWMVRRWLSLGVEYRHSGFDDEKFQFGSSTGNNVRPSDMNVALDNDQVTFRVNWLLR